MDKDELFKQLARKEQEYEELRQYHNKCCEEFENEKQELLEKYNQFSRDFHNGKYCNKENCSLLKAKEQECEELKEAIDNLLKIQYKLADTSNKYNQKLERIREIAEYEFKELMNAEDYHNMTEVLKQILQIIDEVENED